MRSREIVREAARNVVAGVGGGPWLTLALVVVTALSAVVPQLALLDAHERALSFRDSGAATLIVHSPGQIDGRQCEAFLSIPNVVAAGAVSEEAEGITLSVLPRTTVRYFVGSPQFADDLGADRDGSGVLLAADVADALGSRAGRSVLIDGEQAAVAGTYRYPDDGRRAGLGFAVVGERPAGVSLFDECWLTIWPQTPDVQTLAQLAVVQLANGSAAGLSPGLSQLNSAFGATFSVGMHREVWVFSSVGGMVLAALVTFVFVRGRRLEFASARHVGVRAGDQAAIVVTEIVALSILAMTIVLPAAAYLIVTADREAMASVTWWALRGALAVGSGAILGAVLGVLTVRERSLFRYFRER